MSETKTVPVEFIEKIKREMPPNTVIGNPEWWAKKLYRWAIKAAPAPDDELARLERTLSEWFCDDILEDMQLRGILTSSESWSDVSEYKSGLRIKTMRWMELRGLLERHPDDPNLVRLREKE